MTKSVPISCREATEVLLDYVSGELRWDQCERFEAHLSVCPPCLFYLVQYRDTVRLSRAALGEPGDEPPAELMRAILSVRRLA